MKKLLATLALTLLTMTASAQYMSYIRMTDNDGNKVLFDLSRSLTIRFDDNNMIISDPTQTLSVNLDKVQMTYRWQIGGDVNRDEVVDVADISSIISVMASGGAGDGENPKSSAPTRPADVNKDGVIDVADISTVISIMARR